MALHTMESLDSFKTWAEKGGEVDTQCATIDNSDRQPVIDDDEADSFMWTYPMEPVLTSFAHIFKNLKHLVYISERDWPGGDWLKPLTSLRALTVDCGSDALFHFG